MVYRSKRALDFGAPAVYKRQRTRGRPIKRASMLSKLRSDVNKLKRSVEVKHYDTTAGSNSIARTGAQFPVGFPYSIVQGLTDQTRIGDKITVTGYHASYAMTAGGACSLDSFVVLDKQCNGAAATANDIWEAVGDPLSANMLNLDNHGRFKILSRKRVVFDSTQTYKTVEHKLTGLSIPVLYDATTGAVTDLTQNNILLFNQVEAVGDTTLNATAAVRISYTDQ